MDCLFCKIIKSEIPAEIVYEDELALVFRDIHPKAPTHLLIVPKKHVETVDHLDDSDVNNVGHLFIVAKNVAAKMGLKGYNLQVNVGKEGGQIIFHIHMHLLSQST